ncbi:MAG: ATP-binding protein [Bacillota bacterium]
MVAHGFYKKNAGKARYIKVLVVLETLGIFALLIPTGGPASPFVVYAANPVITAAASLAAFWSWGILAALLFVAPARTHAAGWIHAVTPAFPLLVLLTAAIQLLSSYGRQIQRRRAELEESLRLFKSVHQLIEAVSTHDDIEEVLGIFARYSRFLIKADKIFLWVAPKDSHRSGICVAEGPKDLYPQDQWLQEAHGAWSEIVHDPQVSKWTILSPGTNDASVVQIPLCSPTRCHGLFACVFRGGDPGGERVRTMQALADLIAVTLERQHFQELTHELLLAKEQNRIANEIHDAVSQHLYSIACGCKAIVERWRTLEYDSIQEQLCLIEQTARRAARELRDSIFRLSPKRQVREVFPEAVRTYLDELAQLHGIGVELQVQGSEDTLSPALRNTFYRIIREACGNAVRYGKCSRVKVRVDLLPAGAYLEVQDDGRGFSTNSLGRDEKQTGLSSIKHLVEKFNGELEIRSSTGQGTTVICQVPKSTASNR